MIRWMWNQERFNSFEQCHLFKLCFIKNRTTSCGYVTCSISAKWQTLLNSICIFLFLSFLHFRNSTALSLHVCFYCVFHLLRRDNVCWNEGCKQHLLLCVCLMLFNDMIMCVCSFAAYKVKCLTTHTLLIVLHVFFVLLLRLNLHYRALLLCKFISY